MLRATARNTMLSNNHGLAKMPLSFSTLRKPKLLHMPSWMSSCFGYLPLCACQKGQCSPVTFEACSNHHGTSTSCAFLRTQALATCSVGMSEPQKSAVRCCQSEAWL